MYSNLNDQQQFKLNKSNEIKDYFIAEIIARELLINTLSKYIAFFNYFDKPLIALSATSGSISITLFVTVTGAPAGIAKLKWKFWFCIFSNYRDCKKIIRNNTK